MFTHLHCHSEYSVLDGLGKPEHYIEQAKNLGFENIAITDHASISGLIRFQKASKKIGGLKILYGCELYIVNDMHVKEKGEERGHIVVIIKDKKGWHNINRILTLASLEGFYYRPRIDYENFLRYSSGFCVLTGCSSSFIYYDTNLYFFNSLYKKIRNDLYLEILPFDFEKQEKVNRLALELSKKYKLKTVATNDCHYPKREHSESQEVLLAIQDKKKLSDKKRWRFELNDLYLKTTSEMLNSFEKIKYISKTIVRNSIVNTAEVVDKCKNFEIEGIKLNLPTPVENQDSDITTLIRLCKTGFANKIKGKVNNENEYYKRYINEIKVIHKQNFTRYFLVIWELINWCKENNILTGPCRGSSGGSLITYLLNISSLDPIKYNLIFERFISPDRLKLPDIDIDFEDRRRKDVIRHLEEKYGQFNVAAISTFLRMKAKMVFRDVCRVFDVPKYEVNEIAEILESKADKRGVFEYEEQTEGVLQQFFDTERACIKFKEKYLQAVKHMIVLENQIRGYGRHASGFVISDSSLKETDKCNLAIRNNTLSINWEKDDADFMGLTKLDILGLSNLSVMSESIKLIEENYNKKISFNEIKFDDKNIENEYYNSNFAGVFQFNAYAFTNLFRGKYGGRSYRIKNFEDSINTTAVLRPASIHNGMLQKFMDRRDGIELWDTKYKKLKSILVNTYGVVIYQEQLMDIVHKVAGLSYTQADKVRKYLEWQDKSLDEFKDDFVKGCVKNSEFVEDDALSLWNDLVSYAGYSFNKSHAVGYCTISWYNMWFKVYYPTEYLAASLTFSSEEKKLELIKEAFRLNLLVLSPKIGFSKSKVWYAKNNILYMPFVEIKGVGDVLSNEIEKISKLKNGFFNSSGKTKTRLTNILKSIECDDVNTAVFYKDVFTFNITDIFKREYRKLYEDKGIKVKLFKE